MFLAAFWRNLSDERRVQLQRPNLLGPSTMNTEGKPSTGQVRLYDALGSLPPAYEPLFAASAGFSFFHSLPWYRNFTKTVLAHSECTRIFALESPERQPIAALLMRYDASRSWLTTRILSPMSNYYSSLFGIQAEVQGDQMQAALESLAKGIAADRPRWDIVNLRPLAADTPAFEGMARALSNAGMMVQTYFCFGNWYLRVGGRSFAEYSNALPSQLRNTLRRKKEQLRKAGNSRIVVYRGLEGLDEGLLAYERIYASSWKVPEPYPEFVRGLCRIGAENGWLRLGVAYIGEEPAAAQIWIVCDGIANIYKLAYDERFAKLSLGSLLTAQLMELAIDEDKVKEIDYLTGDDPYKRDWMSDRRERWGIMAFNRRTPRGLLAAARHFGARRVKKALARWRSSHSPAVPAAERERA